MFFLENISDLLGLHASYQRQQPLKTACMHIQWSELFSNFFILNTNSKIWKPENTVFHKEFFSVGLYSVKCKLFF